MWTIGFAIYSCTWERYIILHSIVLTISYSWASFFSKKRNVLVCNKNISAERRYIDGVMQKANVQCLFVADQFVNWFDFNAQAMYGNEETGRMVPMVRSPRALDTVHFGNSNLSMLRNVILLAYTRIPMIYWHKSNVNHRRGRSDKLTMIKCTFDGIFDKNTCFHTCEYCHVPEPNPESHTFFVIGLCCKQSTGQVSRLCCKIKIFSWL